MSTALASSGVFMGLDANVPDARYGAPMDTYLVMSGDGGRLERNYRIGRRFDGPDFLFEDRGHATPCWVWQRACPRGKARGYGQVSVRGAAMSAHHAVCQAAGKAIPAGMHPDHLCSQPECVNPDHIEVVTQLVNIRRSRATKLTVEDVKRIHIRAQTGSSQRQIAEGFNIGQSQVSRILRGLRWADIATMMEEI